MDVREKLVELLKGSKLCSKRFDDQYSDETIAIIADYLIANCVTVQELNGCEYCRTAFYTESPFTIITPMGGEVKTQFNFCPNCGRRLPQPPKDFLADYLVDKGVTVQGWISVEDRLPDRDGWYITQTNATGRSNGTHWMPLPEPPKGE